MRLWTLHPQYLDRQGLLALWREGLLAQAVLRGRTKGYRNHPQLERFAGHSDPVAAIATYLVEVRHEAVRRGYRFDAAKIVPRRTGEEITETRGQLLYEWEHLKGKIRQRQGGLGPLYRGIELPDAHPLFRIVSGNVRPWEKRR